MISFEKLSESTVVSLLGQVDNIFDTDAHSYLAEALYSFLELSSEFDEESVAVCLFENFLLVRIYDGKRYVFPFPVDITGEGREKEACYAIAEYAMKEEIPLFFSDVDGVAFDFLKGIFKLVYAVGGSYGCYTVRAASEAEAAYVKYCQLALTPAEDGFFVHPFYDLLPKIEQDRLVIYLLTHLEDAEDYARLLSDTEVNRFWGYDALADFETTDPKRLFAQNYRQMEEGQILSFAISIGQTFVGEVLLYNFDLKGSAEVGIRLFSKYWGQGIAEEVVKMITAFAKDIGLSALYATVDCENVRSLAFFSKYAIDSFEKKHPYNNREVTVFKLM